MILNDLRAKWSDNFKKKYVPMFGSHYELINCDLFYKDSYKCLAKILLQNPLPQNLLT